MENTPELAFGIAALVYAVSVIIWSLPLPFFRRYGWKGMMHSWSSVAVISVLGSLSILKALISPHVENLLGINLDATFDEAFSSINMYRDMVLQHINAVNISSLALGSAMAIMLLALNIASVTGVAILIMSIVCYLISAVFGLLLLIQKALSAVLLFADAIASMVSIASIAGPAMFTAGLILYAVPFARKLGKTLLVVGAGFTLALPVVVVQALPSPSEVQQEIEKSREIQVHSIALQTIKNWQGGVRINVLDRNGTILVKGGGEEFHESRVIHYPYFKLELKDFDPSLIDCSNMTLPPGVSCEKIAEVVPRMIATPESGFINTGDYYNSYENGYRVSLTMPGKHEESGGNGPKLWREATYLPDVWVLGMWIYMQGETGKRDEPVKLIGYEIPENSPKTEKLVCNDVTCWYESVDPYEAWKEEWERYWQEAKYYKLYAENMVQEGEKTSLVWFTNKPVGSDSPLNRFLIFPPVQELRCIVTGVEKRGNETVYKYGIVVEVGDKHVTYFAYLEGAEYTVEGDPSIEIREVDLGELAGKVVKDAGPLNLKPSIEIIGGGPELNASPPVHYMEVYFPGGEFIFGEGYSCEEAMAQYIDKMIEDLMLENSTNPYAEACLECYQNQLNIYLNGTDIIREPGNSTGNHTIIGLPPCVQQGGAMPLAVTVYFTLLKESPLAPWIAPVEWEAFDKDEEYFKKIAKGEYFDEKAINGVDIETHREEWASYPVFRQGLYRDGPTHAGQRLVVAKLQEYKSMSWEKNALARATFEAFNKALEKASQTVPGGPVPIPVANELLGDGESVGMINIVKVAGYTVALAYGLILFVVGLDTVSWFIGGESVGKKIIGGVSSIIHQAYSGVGSIVHAMRGKGIPSMAARREAKAQQDKMLRTLVEERRKNREWYRKMVDQRIAGERKKLLGGLRAGYLKTTSRIHEKILDKAEELEKRGLAGRIGSGILREFSRGYVLRQQAYNLMRDPEYAKKYLDQSMYVKQSRHVMMSPREWAEGFAKMLRDASPSRRIALVDQLARHPEIGRGIVKKWVLHNLGNKELFPYRISAPASFKVASESTKPLVDGLGGRRPEIHHAYTPEFTVNPYRYHFTNVRGVLGDIVAGDVPEILSRAGDSVDVPYIHRSEDPFQLGKEVYDAVRSYESYARTLSEREFDYLGETLLKENIKHHNLSPQAPILDRDGRDAVEVSFWGSVRVGREKVKIETSFETTKESFINTFIPAFEKIGLEIKEAGLVKKDLTVEDTQEYAAVADLRNFSTLLSGDVRESFWWLKEKDDALESFYRDGYTFSDVWDRITSDREGGRIDSHAPSLEGRSQPMDRRWWEE